MPYLKGTLATLVVVPLLILAPYSYCASISNSSVELSTPASLEAATVAKPALLKPGPTGQKITDVFDQIFAETTPYVPQKTDYALELGSMFEDHNLYWTGGTLGFNTGTCLGLDTPYCQQYLSISAGIAGREGYSHAMSFGAVRWQYVQLPKTYSPFVSLFAGVMNSIVPGQVTQHGLAGGSAGLFLYLHESVDLKLEARLGEGRLPFFQIMGGAQIKMDRWVEYFVVKMRDLGIDTAKSTKEAVVTTVTRPGDAMGTVIDASTGAIKRTGEGIGEATERLENAVEQTGKALTSEEGEDGDDSDGISTDTKPHRAGEENDGVPPPP